MKNSGVTLVDVRSEAMDAIKQLKEGNMEVKTATEIRNLLNTVTDTAKVQVEFIKVLPKKVREQMDQDTVKAIAGTLRDRDAELDQSLNEIDKNQNKY